MKVSFLRLWYLLGALWPGTWEQRTIKKQIIKLVNK